MHNIVSIVGAYGRLNIIPDDINVDVIPERGYGDTGYAFATTTITGYQEQRVRLNLLGYPAGPVLFEDFDATIFQDVPVDIYILYSQDMVDRADHPNPGTGHRTIMRRVRLRSYNVRLTDGTLQVEITAEQDSRNVETQQIPNREELAATLIPSIFAGTRTQSPVESTKDSLTEE